MFFYFCANLKYHFKIVRKWMVCIFLALSALISYTRYAANQKGKKITRVTYTC